MTTSSPFTNIDFSTAGRHTTAKVYRALRTAIVRNELPADTPLSQVRIAEQLNVSVTPLREALRLLENEGLVRSETNRRVRVAPMSVADLESIYTMRVLLECFAIGLTVETASDELLAEITAVYDEMTDHAHAEDYEAWSGPHRRFHELLISAGEDRLIDTAKNLSIHAERYRFAYTTQVPMGWANGLVEHHALHQAAMNRNPQQARNALGVHYARVALSSVALIDPCHEPAHFRAALNSLDIDRG